MNPEKPYLVVGLAGRYCAGKSTIGNWLVTQGAQEIDADRLGHEMLECCRDAVVGRFGGRILGEDAMIDRRELGRIVFADPLELAALEAIIHPAMVARTHDLIAMWKAEHQTGAPVDRPQGDQLFSHIILINAALLFKFGLDRVCNLVLWVDAPFWLRFWRGLHRDRRGFFATWNLMYRQKGLAPQSSEGIADIHRVCNLGFGSFRSRVRRILERYYGKK